MAQISRGEPALMYRRFSGLSVMSWEEEEALRCRFWGDRHGCFVFLHVRYHVFCCLDEVNRETKDVVAFTKLSPMPLRGEITSKIHSFELLLCFKGSKWQGCFNCKIGDERS